MVAGILQGLTGEGETMIASVVRLAVEATIHDGQLEAFRAVAQAMSAGSAAEPGTLGYEWFFSADGKQCRLLETYVDADAVLAHFTGPVVGQLVPQLMPLCTMDRFEIYGDPGPKVREMATLFGAKFFNYWTGINR